MGNIHNNVFFQLGYVNKKSKKKQKKKETKINYLELSTDTVDTVVHSLQ